MIAAGAISGVCAELLWTAQGSLMLAYPAAEDQKGIRFGIFWANGRVGEWAGGRIDWLAHRLASERAGKKTSRLCH